MTKKNKRGRPSKGGRVAKTVSVSLLPELYLFLKEEAKKQGMSPGKVIRGWIKAKREAQASMDATVSHCCEVDEWEN